MRKTLGQLLVSDNIITERKLEESLKQSALDHISLADYLLKHEIISEEQLARTYAKEFNIQYLANITEKMANPDLLSPIPLKFLRNNIIMPIYKDNNTAIVTSNPNDFQPIDELEPLLGNNVSVLVASKKTIISAINQYYPMEGTKEVIEELEETSDIPENLEFGKIEEEDILSVASEAPIIKLVNYILYQAVKRQASDIHIEPYEKDLRVRYRIDGVMYSILNLPRRIQSALISRIKIMSNLNIAEKRIPQDGRIQIKVADKAIDIRVSIIPTSYGERVVMRLLDKSKTFGALSTLGFSPHDYKLVTQAIHEPNGIILITGPTGSGKTSTLYSMLNAINSPKVNIITVEDPVEYQMAGISQVQVKQKIGLTFAAALRSILRQDPDIIMIGETRDKETAQIAIQSALTGHLVLSTLHTNSAAATITRLIDMQVEPFLIASTLNIVIAQRLVRKLCNACKKVYEPSKTELDRLGITEQEAKKIVFYKAVDCPECMGSGYKGRLAIFEVMKVTPEIAKLTVEKADTNVIQEEAVKQGMTLLVQDGIDKIKAGLTTVEEVLSVASSQ